jgi:hypothetical protein
MFGRLVNFFLLAGLLLSTSISAVKLPDRWVAGATITTNFGYSSKGTMAYDIPNNRGAIADLAGSRVFNYYSKTIYFTDSARACVCTCPLNRGDGYSGMCAVLSSDRSNVLCGSVFGVSQTQLASQVFNNVFCSVFNNVTPDGKIATNLFISVADGTPQGIYRYQPTGKNTIKMELSNFSEAVDPSIFTVNGKESCSQCDSMTCYNEQNLRLNYMMGLKVE